MESPGRVAFSIFGIDIMWYGLLIGAGFLVAFLMSYFRAPKLRIKKDHVLTIFIAVIPSAIIGARLYYVIFNWDMYQNNWAQIFNIRSGGLAIHGGLILAFLVTFIICKFTKERFLNVADLAVPGIALAQAIGRWGNFFNEEAHGPITDSPIAVIINGQKYVPTFLYESIWCLLLCLFLLWLTRRRKFDGQILYMYGMLYSVERFIVETYRTDSLMIGDLKQAQVISIVIFAVCLALYLLQVYILHKAKKLKKKR